MEEWYKMQIYVYVPLEKFSSKRDKARPRISNYTPENNGRN